MTNELIETRDAAVAILTFNRPSTMNALSNAMIAALLDALDRLSHTPDVGAILITGAGRGFCAGGDVNGMTTRAERDFETRYQELRWIQQIPLRIRQSPKVVVAAVNGAAFGAGFGLALAADFRIVARSARFGAAFASIGYSGDFGTSHSLTRLVGPARARELLILNRRLDADEADRLGLVTRLVDDARLADEAIGFAHAIAAGPRVAWTYMKRNLEAAETESLATVLELEADGQSRCGLTEDHREARTAWMERRGAVFRGC